MTVTSTSRRAGPYAGNGVAAAFPFAFKVFEAADLVVTRLDTLLAVETELTEGADYTVALNPDQDVDPGGSVTLAAALPLGQTLVVTSDLAMVQETVVTNGGGFYPSVFNGVFDRLTILVQQLAEKLGRAFVVPVTANGQAPTLQVMANGILRWDADGQNIEAVAPGSLFGDDFRATSNSIATIQGFGAEFTLRLNEPGRRMPLGAIVIVARRLSPTHNMNCYITGWDPVLRDVSLFSLSSNGSGQYTDWSIEPTVVSGVPVGRSVNTSGLATGGGALTGDLTIDVPAASDAETAAGALATKAVTPAGYAADQVTRRAALLEEATDLAAALAVAL